MLPENPPSPPLSSTELPLTLSKTEPSLGPARVYGPDFTHADGRTVLHWLETQEALQVSRSLINASRFQRFYFGSVRGVAPRSTIRPWPCQPRSFPWKIDAGKFMDCPAKEGGVLDNPDDRCLSSISLKSPCTTFACETGAAGNNPDIDYSKSDDDDEVMPNIPLLVSDLPLPPSLDLSLDSSTALGKRKRADSLEHISSFVTPDSSAPSLKTKITTAPATATTTTHHPPLRPRPNYNLVNVNELPHQLYNGTGKAAKRLVPYLYRDQLDKVRRCWGLQRHHPPTILDRQVTALPAPPIFRINYLRPGLERLIQEVWQHDSALLLPPTPLPSAKHTGTPPVPLSTTSINNATPSKFDGSYRRPVYSSPPPSADSSPPSSPSLAPTSADSRASSPYSSSTDTPSDSKTANHPPTRSIKCPAQLPPVPPDLFDLVVNELGYTIEGFFKNLNNVRSVTSVTRAEGASKIDWRTVFTTGNALGLPEE
ncbi:hypothetical protein BJ085DRAFT_35587 [Dimargaris cristalligena]|uniref:Uncharacterized protein n=1 Tax=Dimargaris cristalligena TaxID=215637 RepID=A0A4P9ZQY7_9FUNG|nr:hypothetical protein BJ085DRAFT_35587 [Dimargaris cristalligena]|eukprot:RKP35916.1 hypothetical protein BJ085DRAFT_35587 [Dimargaris cristalligena]